MKVRKTIYAYSDGSGLIYKNQNIGDGGWGFCITDNPKSKRVLYADGGYKPSTTTNRMELSGFLNCLIHIYGKYTDVTDINIYSDSKYVVESIYYQWVYDWERNGFKKGSKDVPNTDLWKDIITILRNLKRRNISVNVHWIKGHNGNYFNGLADRIAGDSRTSKYTNELYRH